MRHWVIWVIFGIAIVVINRYTGLDTWLTQYFFDPASQSFPARQWHTANLVFHDGLRWLSVAIAMALLLGPVTRKSAQRYWADTLFTVGVALGAAALVTLLKSQSAHSCPWDLIQYSGNAPLLLLFDSTITDGGPYPGRCFPSGHASTAFMWIVLLYSPLPWLAKRRGLLTSTVALLAIAAAAIQIAKGAHFISHILATAWVCWGVTLLALQVRKLLLQRSDHG